MDTFETGWTKHDYCGSPAWAYAIAPTPFQQFDIPTIIVVCGKCDRSTCEKCKKIDWTGKLASCCGEELGFRKSMKKPKPKPE